LQQINQNNELNPKTRKGTEIMKIMKWDEYLKTQQNIYLDSENNADNEKVYENDYFVVWAHMSLHADKEHYFSGEDDDFAMVSNKADLEYLYYDCTLEQIIQSLNED